jgi:hypothetical protein
VREISSLFDKKKQKMKDETDQAQDPQPGSCTVVLPASLQATRKNATGTDKRAFVAGMTSIATITKVKTFDLEIDVDADDLPAEQALPSISLLAAEQIVFKLRDVIALPVAKDEKDKTDYSRSIPPWRKYELRIVESYADDNNEPQGVLESVIALEKLETNR